MTYVLQLAEDSDFEVNEQLIKSLHFMMMKYDLSKRPGRYRRGEIFVRRENDGTTVYEGPPADDVSTLMGELVSAACWNLTARHEDGSTFAHPSSATRSNG